MKANMGTTDRVIRILGAIAIAILYATGTISGVVATIAGIVAVIFTLTGIVSFCPLYAPFKISTRSSK
ncbi:MAG: DUF2892 domain-containing protein [Bacteroidota bacterium]